MSLQQLNFWWKSVDFMPTFIISHTIFPIMVLIVFYFKSFPSFHQLWLYGNLHHIIQHTTFLPFTNRNCMPTFVVSLHMLLYFPSPIMIACQPSLYIYYISLISLNCNSTKASLEMLTFIVSCHILLSFSSPIVIVCQPSSHHYICYVTSFRQL